MALVFVHSNGDGRVVVWWIENFMWFLGYESFLFGESGVW